MGLGRWLFGDKYRGFAGRTVDNTRRACNDMENYPRKKKTGEILARQVREVYLQGGKDNYKYALALWQLSNALYPEQVTKSDYPKLTENLWDRPVYDL